MVSMLLVLASLCGPAVESAFPTWKTRLNSLWEAENTRALREALHERREFDRRMEARLDRQRLRVHQSRLWDAALASAYEARALRRTQASAQQNLEKVGSLFHWVAGSALRSLGPLKVPVLAAAGARLKSLQVTVISEPKFPSRDAAGVLPPPVARGAGGGPVPDHDKPIGPEDVKKFEQDEAASAARIAAKLQAFERESKALGTARAAEHAKREFARLREQAVAVAAVVVTAADTGLPGFRALRRMLPAGR